MGEETIRIPIGPVDLHADLAVPEAASGLVLFAHGSGSGRHSPRNRQVAAVLEEAGLATVLVDLLAPEEERLDSRTTELRFDIAFLTERVVALVDWLGAHEATGHLPIGLFGASTGAAAALAAAAQRPEAIRAVVSRGGRPDLAGDALGAVHQPTLLVVGARDEVVSTLNLRAMRMLAGPTALEIVAGASHLFEEPGALEQVAALAARWFGEHLPSGGA